MRSAQLTVLLAIGLACTPTAFAQLPLTRLKSIAPVSGQPGQTFEFKLTSGDDLEEITALHFTHPGIHAARRMQEVEGQQVPVDNTFDVTINGDVPPGIYEVHAAGMFGVSNPRRFAVCQRPHVAEVDPNNTVEAAQVVELNTSIIGRMDGGTDIDCYKFTAQQGQRVVIDCLAGRLDSSLQATFTLKDSAGKRLARMRNLDGEDPTFVFDVPASGEYIVELHDQTYRSGNEYTYRLDVHTGPQLAFAMPPAGQAGTRQRFTLYGYNLPGGQRTDQRLGGAPLEKLDVDIDIPGEDAVLRLQSLVRSHQAAVDAFSYSYPGPQGPTNPITISMTTRPVTLEVEPNDQPAQAQVVTAPGEYAGQLANAGEMDWFSFPGKPGDVYWLEVVGQRTGSSLDPVMVVEKVTKNAEGAEQVQKLVTQDDEGTNAAQFVFDTFTDDPVYRLACDAEGTYRVGIYDRYSQTRGGPALRYCLSIRPEEPDYRVVAAPMINQNNSGQYWPVGLRKGDTVALPVYAIRKYGYEGPIDIRVEGLPGGVHCPGTTISNLETTGTLVFRTDEGAAEGVHAVRLISTARIPSPAKQRAIDDSKKAIEAAQKLIPDLMRKRDDLTARLAQATQQRDEAAKASQDQPDNEGLKNQLAERQKQLDEVQTQQTAAMEAFVAGEKAVADAKAALTQAQAEFAASYREVTHVVRIGALAVNGQNGLPSEGRLAQSLTLAVMAEPAPFELRSEPLRVQVCQSAQVLVPISLVRRAGFEDRVALNFPQMPRNSNIQANNIAIEKDKSDAIAQILIRENTPPGTYALWLTAQGTYNYSRNPAKAERLKMERDAVAEKLRLAQEASTAATNAKNEATQKANEAAAALQQAQQQKQQADQLVTQRTTERDQIKVQKEAADKKLEEATLAQTAAEKALTEAQAALAGDPENQDKKNAVATAEQAVATAKANTEQATRERDEKVKQLTDAENLLVEAVKAQEEKGVLLTTAETAKTDADKVKADAEAAEKAAQEEVKRLEQKKQQAEQRANEAQNAANPQGKNYTPPSYPVVIEVLPAPLKLQVNIPNGGNIRRGEMLEVTATVDRLNGFEGPVTLSLPLPPGVVGLSASGSIPADQREAKFMLVAGGDATQAQLANMVLRATVEWNGQKHVEVPITINVPQ